jgi:hypothetical protein
VPRQKSQPTAIPISYLDSSTMGLSPSSRAPTIVDPPAPALRQQKFPSRHHRKSLISATCVGASPLPPPHTPLPKTEISKTALRASLPPCCHQGHHCTMCAKSRPIEPMGPLHRAANTLTLRTSIAAAHGPSRPPSTLPQAETSLHKRCLQEGHDADGAIVARPASWTSFHP